MNKTRKQAWKECLRLWKRLSEMEDKNIAQLFIPNYEYLLKLYRKEIGR